MFKNFCITSLGLILVLPAVGWSAAQKADGAERTEMVNLLAKYVDIERARALITPLPAKYRLADLRARIAVTKILLGKDALLDYLSNYQRFYKLLLRPRGLTSLENEIYRLVNREQRWVQPLPWPELSALFELTEDVEESVIVDVFEKHFRGFRADLQARRRAAAPRISEFTLEIVDAASAGLRSEDPQRWHDSIRLIAEKGKRSPIPRSLAELAVSARDRLTPKDPLRFSLNHIIAAWLFENGRFASTEDVGFLLKTQSPAAFDCWLTVILFSLTSEFELFN